MSGGAFFKVPRAHDVSTGGYVLGTEIECARRMLSLRSRRSVCLLALIPLTSGCLSPRGRHVLAEVNDTLQGIAALVPDPSPQDTPTPVNRDGAGAPCPEDACEAAAATPCGDCAIDDVADANDQILLRDGRSGYWYSFVDAVGTTISPPAGRKFIQSPGGAGGLPYAARMLGKVTGYRGPQFAGMGFNFTSPRRAYDASKYRGVSFYAKVGGSSQTRVLFSMPDVDTDPQGDVCTICSNDFGVVLDLSDQWQRFAVDFAKMHQQVGWGAPEKDQIDPAKVYGLQWQVRQPAASYDVWVSDVRFCRY